MYCCKHVHGEKLSLFVTPFRERTEPAGACAQAVTESLGGRDRVDGSCGSDVEGGTRAAGAACVANVSPAEGTGTQTAHEVADMQQSSASP
ncbi:unnamed protein product [Ciceribacter sp. T2.26MG-112.2]|nr:unnamed protein product [Ciceribacter naphthalenivorans]